MYFNYRQESTSPGGDRKPEGAHDYVCSLWNDHNPNLAPAAQLSIVDRMLRRSGPRVLRRFGS
ncbi:hypothetical protein [Bradyrhizobium sp. S3.2.12]|uniref:hypothetical protein n=1 Tax=Bradyrhizobium sp. S3.2.12 TaxID=3156387 RepID=UPI003395EADC